MKQKTKKSFLSRAILAGFLCGGMFVMSSAWAEITVNEDKNVEAGTTVNSGSSTIESSGRTYVIGAVDGVNGTVTVGDGTGTITLHNETGTNRRYGVAQNYSGNTLTINGNLVFDIPEGNSGVRAVAVRNNYGNIVINGNVTGNINADRQYATVYDVWYGASTTVNGNTDITATTKKKASGSSGTPQIVMQVNSNGYGATTLTLGGISTRITGTNAGTGGDEYTVQLSSDYDGTYNFNSTDESIFKVESTYGCAGFIDNGSTTYNFDSKKTVIENVITDGVGKAHNVGLYFIDSDTVVNALSTVDGSEFTINIYGNGANDPDSGVYGTYGIDSEDGSDINISTQNFNVHVESGHAVDDIMTFESSQVVSSTYSDIYGIYALDGTTIDTLATTDTNIFVKDYYESGKDAYGIYADGSNTVINLIGNVTIDTYAAGTGATAYAVCAAEGGTVTLGGAEKTVSLTGDIYATGENTSVSVTGKAPTTESGVTTYYATINGGITVDDQATVNLTNAEYSGGRVYVCNNDVIQFNATNSNFAGSGQRLEQQGGQITLSDVDFISDGTQSGCHAISTVGGTINFVGSSTFSGNDSTSASNAFPGVISLENHGNVVITGDTTDSVVFENNKGQKGGAVRTGAQYADGGLFKVSGVDTLTFEGNQAVQGGGAISSEPSNGALSKKAIDLSANTINFIGNSVTGNNTVGGAINNQNSGLSLTANTILFSGNIANDTGSSGEKYGGGAFYQRAAADSTVSIGSTAEGATVTFSGNKSNTIGGAVGVRATGGVASVITIDGVTEFSGNTSKLSGGAIWNKVEGGSTSTITFEDDVTFSVNKAGVDLQGAAVAESTAKGGAIDNYGTITFAKTATFTNNSAAGLGGAIYNAAGGTITFNSGSTFSGNTAAGVANDIYNEGTITFAGGTNILDGGITGNGSGTVAVSSGATLQASKDMAIDGTLTVSGKLNLSGTEKAINTLSVGTFAAESGSTIDFDADITGSKQESDKVAATGTVSGTIALGSVNIAVGDSLDVHTKKTLTLFTSAAENGLSGLTITGTATATSDGYKYEFKQDTTSAATKGNLVATKEYGGELHEVIQNSSEGLGKVATYSLVGDYTAKADLGTLTRVAETTPREFTINGNSHVLNGNGKTGVAVNAGDTLNLTKLSDVTGFNGAVVTNAGTLKVTDSKVSGAITNSGSLEIIGTTELAGAVTNSGTMTVTVGTVSGAVENSKILTVNGGKVSGNITNTGEVTVNAGEIYAITNDADDAKLTANADYLKGAVTNTKGTVVLNGGVLTQTITGGALTISGEVTTSADNLKAAVTNNGTISLTAGTLTQAINAGTLNVAGDVTVAADKLGVDTEVKSGSLTVDGILTKVINGAGTIKVADTKTLTTSADNLNAAIVNSGTISLTAGTLTQVISAGTLNVAGDVTAAGDMLGVNTEIVSGSLTVDGDLNKVINGEGTIKVADTKTLTTSADNLKAAIANSGTISLTAGTLTQVISAGTLNVAGDVTAAADMLGVNTEIVSGSLTVDGTLAKVINGAGTIKVADTKTLTTSADNLKAATVTNDGSIALTGGELTVALVGTLSNSGELKTDAGNLDAALTNTGVVTFTGGQLDNVVSGTGSIVVDTDKAVTTSANNLKQAVTNNGSIALTGGELTVALAGTLSNSGELKTEAAYLGAALTNTGEVELTGGTLSYAIQGADGVATGTTEISGTVTLKAEVSNPGGINVTSGGTLAADAAFVGAALTNSGKAALNVVSEDLAKDITTTGTNAVTVIRDAQADYNVTSKITAANGGVVNLFLDDYSKASYDTNSGAGTINAKSGVIHSNDDTGALEDAGTLATGTKLTLVDSGTYNSLAKYVFSVGDTLSTPNSVTTDPATERFNFNGGIIEVTDEQYSYTYLTAASNAVKDLGTTKLVMKGTLKADEVQDVDDTLDTEKASTIGENVVLPNAKVEAQNVNTLIGSVTTEETTIDGKTMGDKQAEGFNVNKLDLKVGSDTLVITNKRTVVLGGDKEESGNNLISVGGSDEAEVTVVVGVSAEDDLIEGTATREGTFGIGIDGHTKADGYQLKGNITANVDSTIEIGADAEITGKVILDNATMNVDKGATATVGKVLEVKNDSAISGNVTVIQEANLTSGSTLAIDAPEDATETTVVSFTKLDLDDSSMNVAKGVEVKSENLTVGSVNGEVKKSYITGIVETGNLTVTDSTAEVADKKIIIYIGKDDKEDPEENGQAVVKAKETKLGGNTILLDPAWKSGVGLEGASSYVTETVDLDGHYIVGQNSIISYGTMDKAEAEAAFTASQLTWGKDNVTAAAYIAKAIDVDHTDGASLIVDGQYTSETKSTDLPAGENGNVAFGAKSLLMVDADICLNAAAITGVKSITVDSTSKLYIADADSNKTYTILAGENINSAWAEEQIVLSDILAVDSVVANGTSFIVTTKEADVVPTYISSTAAPATFTAMICADDTTEAYKYMKALCVPTVEEAAKIAEMNRNADMSEELGVLHNHFNVSNMTEDAVAKHLAMDTHSANKEVWAQAIHSKENVSGLGLAAQGNGYDTQYNGAIVGVDFVGNEKTTYGVALTYIDGKATAAYGSHNEGKYYGATLYGRSVLGKATGLQYDISYVHSDNDLTLGSGVGLAAITGDQKVDSFSIGARLEQEVKVGNSSSFVPHIGLRWLNLMAASYKNNLGTEYDPDAARMFILPLGLSFKASMENSGWKMNFLADGGYQWNLGDRDYTQHTAFNGKGDSFDVAFADKGNWYAGAGFEFNKKNFTGSVGYRYAKSENTRQNKWSMNLSWAF